MNPRIHMAIFIVFLAAHSVDSSINSESSVAKQKFSGFDQKPPTEDLYIDDEGDDDIQLADEASGLGPLKPALGVEDEEEEEEEEEEEVDEYDDNPAPVEAAKKAKDAGTTATTTTTNNGGSSNNNKNITAGIVNSDYKDDVAPPKVSPVAASPSMGKPPAVDDDEDDENFDGSGGSGAGTGSNVDDENEEEEDYEDGQTDEDGIGGIDLGSVITEPVPKTTMMPEKKPEVVVVPPPSAPTKAPKETTQAPSSPTPPSSARDENQVPVEPITTPVPRPMDPSQGGGSLDGNRGHNDVQILDHKPDERQASFFAQPGILAAVIGGAVVGLLCAILLVMFIVYRMRKKDEGSYVLDEPKRNSPNSNPYNKNSREFYA